MSRRTMLLPAAALLTALALSACGSSSASSNASSGPASGAASASGPSCAGTTASGDFEAGTGGVTVTGEPGSKPTVTVSPETAGTTKLIVCDLKVGDGATIAPGDTVTAHYVGIGASTGKQFDSSWDRGQPVQFPLSGVITGWQNGIPGMKVGGRRLLVIPGDQAYGANPQAGSGIQPNETLVFVVDLVSSP